MKMALLWGCPLLLVAAAFLLGGCSGSSWHSLRYFYTMIWAPDQGEPDFIAVAYLDDQLGGHYNSTTRRAVAYVPWIRNVEKDDPDFWVRNTWRAIRYEQRMKEDLKNLRKIYNQSRGLRIWQHMFGCELNTDGSKRGFLQFAYNGEDYINFDRETVTWTAVVVPAQVTKRKWDADLEECHWLKTYLEEECIDWLQKFLEYGKESLLRREPPMVTVRQKVDYDGLETLLCRAHGFHPKEIDVTWRKDGEVWEQETLRGGVVPNSDGTYHTWLSTKIHPEARGRYRCHVEHDGLPEPLDFAWEEELVLPRLWLIVGIVLVAATTLFVPGIVFYFWRRQRTTKQPTELHQVSDQL
ncbi:UNVERIFIED_CONTAM: hypothetical protein K2H54_065413 [Gekko kuhli]